MRIKIRMKIRSCTRSTLCWLKDQEMCILQTANCCELFLQELAKALKLCCFLESIARLRLWFHSKKQNCRTYPKHATQAAAISFWLKLSRRVECESWVAAGYRGWFETLGMMPTSHSNWTESRKNPCSSTKMTKLRRIPVQSANWLLDLKCYSSLTQGRLALY